MTVTLPPVTERPLLRISEVVAADVGLTNKNQVLRLVHEGQLQAVILGRTIKVVNADLRRLCGLDLEAGVA